MAPWSLALPVLKRVLSIARLARLMGASRDRVFDPARQSAIAKAAWWASRVQPRRFPDNCLERSLVSYRYLGLAGADPELVLGVRRAGTDLIGHAWVIVDGNPVHDSAADLESYSELARFGRGGTPTAAASVRSLPSSIAWR